MKSHEAIQTAIPFVWEWRFLRTEGQGMHHSSLVKKYIDNDYTLFRCHPHHMRRAGALVLHIRDVHAAV